jgi:hypothetical protein
VGFFFALFAVKCSLSGKRPNRKERQAGAKKRKDQYKEFKA